MYSATMEYDFKLESFDDACKLWKEEIMELAATQPGFVRMQFFTAPPKALAVGTWENPDYAKKFMQTGVFKNLMVKLKENLNSEPVPHVWNLLYFEQK